MKSPQKNASPKIITPHTVNPSPKKNLNGPNNKETIKYYLETHGKRKNLMRYDLIKYYYFIHGRVLF